MSLLSPKTIELINTILKAPLTKSQIEQFALYRDLLIEWNQKMNLTAVRTPEGIEMVHFVDSLSVLLVTDSLEDLSLIDIGTGAGFPGIPLKIIFPTLRLTLVESIRKKASFLQTAVDALSLEQVDVLDERAEVLGRDEAHRELYDWAVGRAVAELNVLLEYLTPFCKVNGRVLAMKGPELDNELASAQKAISELQLNQITSRQVPANLSGEKARHLIVFEKMEGISERYPRRPGIPTKRPLR